MKSDYEIPLFLSPAWRGVGIEQGDYCQRYSNHYDVGGQKAEAQQYYKPVNPQILRNRRMHVRHFSPPPWRGRRAPPWGYVIKALQRPTHLSRDYLLHPPPLSIKQNTYIYFSFYQPFA